MKTIEELMSVRLIPEILSLCSACKNQAEVVQVLQKNQSPALRLILQYAFYPGVEFDTQVPQWRPDPNPYGLSPNSLFIEARRLYLFTKAKQLPAQKKTELLLNVLESVHPSEAELLVNLIKNRDLGIKNITVDTVRLAFPNILPRTS